MGFAGDNRIKPYLNFFYQERLNTQMMVSFGEQLMGKDYTLTGNLRMSCNNSKKKEYLQEEQSLAYTCLTEIRMKAS